MKKKKDLPLAHQKLNDLLSACTVRSPAPSLLAPEKFLLGLSRDHSSLTRLGGMSTVCSLYVTSPYSSSIRIGSPRPRMLKNVSVTFLGLPHELSIAIASRTISSWQHDV